MPCQGRPVSHNLNWCAAWKPATTGWPEPDRVGRRAGQITGSTRVTRIPREERIIAMATKASEAIPAGYVQLKGSERRPPRAAKVAGEVDKQEKFSVTIVLRRRKDGPALAHFDYFSKTPPRRRMRLPHDEFAEKYGAHPDEINAIEKFARRNGLTVKNSHAG